MPRRERPLDAENDVLTLFAAGLRRLRGEAGGPTYRELGRHAHYSAGTLSEAANGRALPTLAVTLAYVRACAGDAAVWEQRWHDTAAALAAETIEAGAGDDAGGESPYVGLTSFQPEDADRFFGREELVDDLFERLKGERLVSVFGASGCGKSSLLRAGLIARLRADPTVQRQVVLLSPGPHPLEECAIQLAALADASAAQLSRDLRVDTRNLHRTIRQICARRVGTEVVLVVDQFEEIFTQCDREEREAFVAALVTATRASSSLTRVVLGVRADFYPRFADYPELADAVSASQVLVGSMTTEQLRRAITGPATESGDTVEGALVAELISETTGQAGALPLLSHVLLETWRRRRGNTLTVTGYQAAGGVRGALARTADEVYTGLGHGRQETAKQIFLRLCALGEGTEDTKRRIGRDELDSNDPDTGIVLDQLAEARLVILDQDTVELTHEALIRHWPRLRDWLTDDRDSLRIHRQLTEATAIWEAHHRDPDALYRGNRLEVAQSWAAQHGTALAPREREFLNASLATEARERATTRRRTRRLRRLVALLTVLLLIAGVTTGLAVHAQQTATQQRTTAVAQKTLRDALALRATNPALAHQLALAAYRLDPSKAARDTLHELFATPYATRLETFTDAVVSATTSPNATKGTVRDTAVSGDSRLLASVQGQGGGVTVWDINDPFRPQELHALPPAAAFATSAAFHPKGRTLATTSPNGRTQLWDLTDPHHPVQLTSLTNFLDQDNRQLGVGAAVTFSPDGQVLATVDVSWTTRLWDLTDPQHPALLATIPSGPDTSPLPVAHADVAFSPDGHVLATLARDHTIRLWEITSPHNPQPIGTLQGNTTRPGAVAFSPTGSMIATSSNSDPTVRLWNVTDPRNPELLTDLTSHSDVVTDLAFSPDGQTFATTGYDAITRLWNVADLRRPSELSVLTGHAGTAVTLTFSPNGRTLITGGNDRTVRLVDLSPVVLASHSQAVFSVAYRPRSNIVASTSSDQTLRLWDLTDHRQPRLLHTIPTPSSFSSVSFSSNGRLLVATSQDNIHLWNVSDSARPQSIATIHIPTVVAAVFSPDNRVLAITKLFDQDANQDVQLLDISDPHQPRTAGQLSTRADHVAFHPDGHLLTTDGKGRKLRLWNIHQPSTPRNIATIPAAGNRAAFSPDGDLLALSNTKTSITRLWDFSDPHHAEPLGTIPTEQGMSNEVSFSPNGQQLVTIGPDTTARVWNITNPRQPAEQDTLRGHTTQILTATYSPDGNTILTADDDHIIQQWQTNIEDLAARICDIAHPRITKTEWDTHFPNIDYQPPCT